MCSPPGGENGGSLRLLDRLAWHKESTLQSFVSEIAHPMKPFAPFNCRHVRDHPETARMAVACAESILASMSLVGRSFMYPWLALVVRSRHEKSVQTILDAKGYRTSVPLVRCIHKRSLPDLPGTAKSP